MPQLIHHSSAAAVLARVRAGQPRVQCLTNTVAQEITANVLLAAGARVSMATHPDEVVEMTASADAHLINLGTLDAARVAAIPNLLDDARVSAKPRVLDPVFVEHSSLRLKLARAVIANGPLIVKGNAAELVALQLPTPTTRVETGAMDRVGTLEVSGGSAYMAQVTGLGCALGAMIAACAAVERDPVQASVAALILFKAAGARAAQNAAGPASFAVAFVDGIATMKAKDLATAVVRTTHA